MSEQAHKVLVVDDDEAVRKSLCRLLHGEGYQVAAVADGADAVKMFCGDRNQIDMLLLDLNMPLKNGWATLDRLLEVYPFLSVLIVTGQPNQREMAEAAGVSGLVEKPIDVPLLLQLIHTLLAGPRLYGTGHQGVPFHLVRAAGYTTRHSWTNLNAIPYHHGGLNE